MEYIKEYRLYKNERGTYVTSSCNVIEKDEVEDYIHYIKFPREEIFKAIQDSIKNMTEEELCLAQDIADEIIFGK